MPHFGDDGRGRARTSSVWARNSAAASGNPLHDPIKAVALGYEGALISGADTFGYLVRPPVERWGIDWLRRGVIEARLLRPVFNGQQCTLAESAGDDDTFAAELRVDDQLRATARYQLRAEHASPATDDIPWRGASSEPLRPASDLVAGTVLPTLERKFGPDEREQPRDGAAAAPSLFLDEQLLHPFFEIKLATTAIAAAMTCDVLIHVATELRHVRPISATASLEARGRVLAHFDTRGHQALLFGINLLVDGKLAASLRQKMIHRLAQST